MNGLQKTLAAAGIVLTSTASAFAFGDGGGGCGGCGGGGTSNGGSGQVVAQTCDSTWVRRGHLTQADVDQNSAKRRAFTKMSQKADGICGGFDDMVCKSGKVRDAFAGSALACPTTSTTVIIREPAPKPTAPVVVAPKEKPPVVVPTPRPAPKIEAPAACPTPAPTKADAPVCPAAPVAKPAAPLASFGTTFNLDQAAMDKFCADQFAARAAIPATPVAPAGAAAPTSGAPTQTAGTPAPAMPSVSGTLKGTCQASVGADGRMVLWRFVPTR